MMFGVINPNTKSNGFRTITLIYLRDVVINLDLVVLDIINALILGIVSQKANTPKLDLELLKKRTQDQANTYGICLQPVTHEDKSILGFDNPETEYLVYNKTKPGFMFEEIYNDLLKHVDFKTVNNNISIKFNTNLNPNETIGTYYVQDFNNKDGILLSRIVPHDHIIDETSLSNTILDNIDRVSDVNITLISPDIDKEEVLLNQFIGFPDEILDKLTLSSHVVTYTKYNLEQAKEIDKGTKIRKIGCGLGISKIFNKLKR